MEINSMKKTLMYIGEENEWLYIKYGEIYTDCVPSDDYKGLYKIHIKSRDVTGNYDINKFIDFTSNRLVKLLCE